MEKKDKGCKPFKITPVPERPFGLVMPVSSCCGALIETSTGGVIMEVYSKCGRKIEPRIF
ncbi:MAG TPA: hypothetical protein DIT25_02295 [Candidatus Moranbacteria bacterium]|nr:hypothetical protein [Candidatus Moranbacteria bacterium]